MQCMVRPPIVAVTLDAGNTLLYSDPTPSTIYARALSRHGRRVRAEDVGPVFAAAWAEMQSRVSPGADRYRSVPGGEREWWGAFLREVLRRLNHDAAWEPLLDELYATFSDPEVWRAFPDVRDCLARMRGRGLKLAVVSNWDRRLPEILDALGLARHLDTVTVSGIEGVEKPAGAIFQRTVERLEVDAGRCLHVGDSPRDDYQGAIAAGLEAVLLDRRGAFDGTSYRRISSLHELMEMLEAAT